MGRIPVDAGSMVRSDDRRLDHAERTQISSQDDIFASGSSVDHNRSGSLRRANLHDQLHRRALLFDHHDGRAGNAKIVIQYFLHLQNSESFWLV